MSYHPKLQTDWRQDGPERGFLPSSRSRRFQLYPYFCVVQVNNVFNMPQQLGDTRRVAYPHPQVVFQYYDGRTGDLAYAESISTLGR
jgi:hypothetical protein